MTSHPPIHQNQNRGRSSFAGLRRDRERSRRQNSPSASGLSGSIQKQPLILPNSPTMSSQTPDWFVIIQRSEAEQFLRQVTQPLKSETLHGVLKIQMFWRETLAIWSVYY
jgi:hypothetical protein